ncbi:MAG: hypothetical protein Q8P67_24545 [archaeon]|nr:hypothetical protein [archaeon]
MAISMTKAARGAACKLCNGPADVYSWKPSRKEPLKRTRLCAQCSHAQHLCPCCLLDYDFGLSKQVRDATIGAPLQAAPIIAVGASALALTPSPSPSAAEGGPLLLTHAARQQVLETLQHKTQQARRDREGARPEGAGAAATVWMGHLQEGDGVTEERLRALFGPFGAIAAVRFNSDRNSAFVQFDAPLSAQTALQQLGKSVQVDEKHHPIRFGTSKSSSSKLPSGKRSSRHSQTLVQALESPSKRVRPS